MRRAGAVARSDSQWSCQPGAGRVTSRGDYVRPPLPPGRGRRRYPAADVRSKARVSWPSRPATERESERFLSGCVCPIGCRVATRFRFREAPARIQLDRRERIPCRGLRLRHIPILDRDFHPRCDIGYGSGSGRRGSIIDYRFAKHRVPLSVSTVKCRRYENRITSLSSADLISSPTSALCWRGGIFLRLNPKHRFSDGHVPSFIGVHVGLA